VRVRGHVQGVFFRDTARNLADHLGLAGSALNLPDGGVELVFEGPRAAVERGVTWAREGPEDARVTGIEVHWEPAQGLVGFDVG
jgi:acylphosphatase